MIYDYDDYDRMPNQFEDYYNEELDDLYDDDYDYDQNEIEQYSNWDYYYHNVADEIED
jgi:hypothetical protein